MKTLLNHSQGAAHDSKGSISLITRLGLLLILTVAFSVTGFSSTIPFTVPSNMIGVQLTGFSFGTNALNGTALNGQTLSLDLLFADDVLARVILPTPAQLSPGEFFMGLSVQTNVSKFPGFPGQGSTGFFYDANGQMFGPVLHAGGGAGNNGTFSVGIDTKIPNQVADFSGMHLELILPNTGFTITNVIFDGGVTPIPGLIDDRLFFGTASQLPEPSIAGGLMLGIAALGLVSWKRARLASMSSAS